MPEQSGSASGTQKRFFERGQRVAFGDRVGIVESTFPDGVHYIFLEDEKRLVAVPGKALVLADDPRSEIKDSMETPIVTTIEPAPSGTPPSRSAPAA